MSGKKHVSKTSWTKGKSGNPGGRSPRVGPNGETLAELARAKTKEMLGVLEEIALDKTAEKKDRITAANSVLARGWGSVRPASDDPDNPDKPDLAETLARLIHALPS